MPRTPYDVGGGLAYNRNLRQSACVTHTLSFNVSFTLLDFDDQNTSFDLLFSLDRTDSDHFTISAPYVINKTENLFQLKKKATARRVCLVEKVKPLTKKDIQIEALLKNFGPLKISISDTQNHNWPCSGTGCAYLKAGEEFVLGVFVRYLLNAYTYGETSLHNTTLMLKGIFTAFSAKKSLKKFAKTLPSTEKNHFLKAIRIYPTQIEDKIKEKH